ncbi:PaaI family thioesterase [Frigoribacterium sp. RIT-PI-h]|uniref:PaaI family thioesterase n=1 Tax=Frigoribacterium sp. RIT-PI-h TaxID=1690245 RepID=UPI0006B958F3|nr:PaaI family thioesterase [Frigoribacterium sp. RIT-PI-h]KPG82379.1 phenylacetic acid degradation protein PaaI [Frigoribacterium sp. RIT-PI-h]
MAHVPGLAIASIRARVKASFDRQGLLTHLGATLDRVDDGMVSVILPRRPEVSQQHGYVHAGATSAIGVSADGYAALTRMEEGSEVLTVGYKLNLIAPARGEYLCPVGTVVRAGCTLTMCQIEVRAVDGDTDAPIAIGQQTLIRASSPTPQ